MRRMLHVRERVPLRRRLRIEVVQEVVEHEFRIRENLDGVGMLAAGEQRRIGDVDRQIQCEHFARSNRVGRLDHAIGRQQVDGADFVVVAEDAPRRARRRARADREFVVAGESWRRMIRRRRIARVARAATSPTFRTTARSISVIPLSKSTDARVAEVTRRLLVALTRREIFFGAGFFDAFDRNCALGAFRCGLLSLDRFGSDFADFGRRFLHFLFRLGQCTGPPELLDRDRTFSLTDHSLMARPTTRAISPALK